MKKKSARIRRAIGLRAKFKKLKATRLVVYKTSNHTYAQIISHTKSKVLVVASTLEPNIIKQLNSTSNKTAAAFIGKIIAERALLKGINHVSLDRSGFKYHGRIKVLAEAARKAGLYF